MIVGGRLVGDGYFLCFEWRMLAVIFSLLWTLLGGVFMNLGGLQALLGGYDGFWSVFGVQI